MITEYKFIGLSASEIFDPTRPTDTSFEETKIPRNSLGDIPTYVLSVSAPMLVAVVAYLLQKRKGTKFKQKYIEVHPDGRRIEKSIEYTFYENEGADSKTIAAIIEQITNTPQ